MNVLPILRFGINANMSYTDQDNANTSLFSAQGFRPDLPIYNDNGEFDLSSGSANPVANTYKKNHNNIYRIMGTVSGKDSASVPAYQVIYNLLKTIHLVQVF